MSIKARKSRAQPIGQLLSTSHEGMGGLLNTARLIDRAQQQLDRTLLEEMRGHVLVGGHHQGQLTLLTDRAVWLTWLRFERRRLLQIINHIEGLEDVLTLSFKVRPLRKRQAPAAHQRHLSASAAEQLKACAEEVENTALQRALQRLAAHALPTLEETSH